MIITEPSTLLTDYALAAGSSAFAISLFRIGFFRQQISIRLWALAFGCVAIAAILGGTCHGFIQSLGREASSGLWQAMVYSLSLASFLMLSATIISTLPRRFHHWILVGVALKSLVYLSWAGLQNNFAYVIGDYLSAMAIVLMLEIKAIDRHQHPGAVWIVAGVLVSCVGVGVQWGRWGLTESLNYNDLYHLVQMMALSLFYRGACLLKDS